MGETTNAYKIWILRPRMHSNVNRLWIEAGGVGVRGDDDVTSGPKK
jgi:hypothetical protein